MDDIQVRPAVPTDFDAIARLTVEAYRLDGQLSSDHGYDKVLADVPARAKAGEILVAASASGVVLGAVLFVLPGTRFAELAGPGEAEFRMLAVDPTARGRGIGEKLVRACLVRAQQEGATAVVIYTRDFARPAHRLYERLGFVRIPDRDATPLPSVNLLALRLALPSSIMPAGGASRVSVGRSACADGCTPS